MPRHSSAAKALRPFRSIGRRLHHETLLIPSIVLILLAVVLANLLLAQTYKDIFKCAFLIGQGLNWDTLCKGYTLGSWQILPRMNDFDPSLDAFRRLIVWTILLFFAVASLVLAFVAGKVIGFVRFVMTPEGRKVVLTNLSLWLLFFVIFCTLFYVRVVLGK